MPHSGGRVGKGIYFASENGKSSGYGMFFVFLEKFPWIEVYLSTLVGTASDGSHHNIGIMFLVDKEIHVNDRFCS